MGNRTPEDDSDAVVRRGKVAIGKAVRAGRLRVRASQHTFAIYAGVSQPVISRLETGKLNGIRWQTLARIVGVLDRAGAFHIPSD